MISSNFLSLQASDKVLATSAGHQSASSPPSTSAAKLSRVDVRLSAMPGNVEMEIHDAVTTNKAAPRSVVAKSDTNPVSNLPLPLDGPSLVSQQFPKPAETRSSSSASSFRSDSSGLCDDGSDVGGSGCVGPKRRRIESPVPERNRGIGLGFDLATSRQF